MEVSPRIIAIYGVVVMHDWSNSVQYCVYVVVMLGLYLVCLDCTLFPYSCCCHYVVWVHTNLMQLQCIHVSSACMCDFTISSFSSS